MLERRWEFRAVRRLRKYPFRGASEVAPPLASWRDMLWRVMATENRVSGLVDTSIFMFLKMRLNDSLMCGIMIE